MGTQGVRSLGGMRSPIWWYTLAGSDGEPTFTGTSAPDRTGQTEMSDGPAADDFRAKVFRDRKHTEDWRVEKMDEDGSSENCDLQRTSCTRASRSVRRPRIRCVR
jgi:hypothetical protein